MHAVACTHAILQVWSSSCACTYGGQRRATIEGQSQWTRIAWQDNVAVPHVVVRTVEAAPRQFMWSDLGHLCVAT
eukprot:1265548-Pleurochrysis_carterae.AAC.1